MKKRTAYAILGIFFLSGACFPLFSSQPGKSFASFITKKAAALQQEYEFTPEVHSVDYTGKELHFEGSINLVLDDRLDEYTVKKAHDVLSQKDVISLAGTEPEKDKINVIIGIDDFSPLSSRFSEEKRNAILGRNDAYFLSIEENGIYILGKDTDACFYGLTTLDQIFSQSSDELQCLTIEDYSDSVYRGFIEGYYGIPWTKEEREELMRFGSRFKTNAYIYAPKDDSYHSSNWRGLYTSSDYNVLQEEIKVGEETKTHFVWSIHPFLYQPITEANYNESLTAIKNKFNQVYDAGCRQFMVSADDVAATDDNLYKDGGLQKNLLNDLVKWNEEKGDNKELLFVPSAYCYLAEQRLKVDKTAYFSTLMDGLSEKVNLMWTGNDVCSKLSTGKFTEFSSLTGGRKPVMWLNWPVNDYATDHLLMGEAEVLDEKYTVDNNPITGIITNPMQQAEPSKPAIAQIADYTWNINDFNADNSYKRAMKYTEIKETDAFIHLSSHLTNTNEYDGGFFKEAEDLLPLKEKLDEDISNNNLRNDTSTITSIIAYCSNLEKEADSFITNAENRKLVNSMQPWIEAIKDEAACLRTYLVAYQEENDLSLEELEAAVDEAARLYEQSQAHTAPVLDKILYDTIQEKVKVGERVLTPMLESVRNYCRIELNIKLQRNIGTVYSGFEGVYEPGRYSSDYDPDNKGLSAITDDDINTYCWFQGKPSDNAFVLVDLGQKEIVNDIRINFRNKNGDGDVLTGDVEVSEDGFNFVKVGETMNAENTIDLRWSPKEARYIRISNQGSAGWVSISDISVNHLSLDERLVDYAGFKGIYQGTTSNIVDDDDSTFCWFNEYPEESACFTLDLRQITKINDIRLRYVDSDIMFGKIEVSSDNQHWTEVGTSNAQSVDVDLRNKPVEGRYIRVSNDGATKNWVSVADFSINRLKPLNGVLTYSGIKLDESVNTSINNMIDGDLSTYSWFAPGSTEGAGFILDLGESKDISSVHFYQTKDGSPNDMFSNLTFSYSEDGNEFMTFENGANVSGQDIDIVLSDPIKARYIKAVSNTGVPDYGVVIREFSVNGKYVTVHNLNLYTTSPYSNKENMIDGDEKTYAWIETYRKSISSDSYITLDLGELAKISNVYLYQTKDGSPTDMFNTITLSYSTDGKTFTPFDGGTDLAGREKVRIDLEKQVEARFIRLTPGTSDSYSNDVIITEFGVNAE